MFDTGVAHAPLQRLHHLRRPGARIDPLVPFLDPACRVDHHTDALRALGRVDVGAVRGADRPVGVADQWEVEAELLGEGLVRGGGIERDAQDDGALRVVVGLEVAEPATFGRSARVVGLRVEPQDDLLPFQLGQRDRLSGVIAAHELGRSVARFEHVASLFRVMSSAASRPADSAGVRFSYGPSLLIS